MLDAMALLGTTLVPEPQSNRQRISIELLPPQSLVAMGMQFTVVHATTGTTNSSLTFRLIARGWANFR
jgi:hypothetical protein